MTPRKTFRLLIILALTLIPLIISVGYYSLETLPPTLQEYWFSDESGDFSTWQAVFITIILVMFIVALAGMWFFKHWARPLYIIMMVTSIPIYFMSGITIMTPLESLLNDTSLVIDGLLLAMMLTGPVSNEFTRTQ